MSGTGTNIVTGLVLGAALAGVDANTDLETAITTNQVLGDSLETGAVGVLSVTTGALMTDVGDALKMGGAKRFRVGLAYNALMVGSFGLAAYKAVGAAVQYFS